MDWKTAILLGFEFTVGKLQWVIQTYQSVYVWYMFICRLQHFRNNKEDVEFHVILSAHQPEY